MYLYQTYEEKLNHVDIGSYTGFGIIVLFVSEDSEEELFRVSDISVDKSVVDNMSELYTQVQLEPIHIYDVIEDTVYS